MRARLYHAAVILLISLLAASAIRSAHRSPVEKTPDGTLLIQAAGYHDTIRITARLDAAGRYRELRLLESTESPLYASKRDIRDYLSRLDGFDPKEIGEVDGITGATITTEAIRTALMQSSPVVRWVELIVYLVLWMTTLILAASRRRSVLFILSGLWFVAVGVFYNSSVGIYSFFTLPGVFHALPLLAFASVLLYRNIYCSHVCPFGFLQRLTRMAPPKKKLRMPRNLKAGKYFVLAMAVLSALLAEQLYLEPYSFLFSRKLKTAVYLLPAVFFGASFFIPLFWCRGFCPVGAIMRIGAGLRRWIVDSKPPALPALETSGAGAVGLTLLAFGTILLSNVLLYLWQ
jgi:NosR/NirI family nitrous oxide reductase transcriptional regulator